VTYATKQQQWNLTSIFIIMSERRYGVTKWINLPDRDAVRFWTKELGCTEALLRIALSNVGSTTDRLRA
jgi:hypothetical protein